MTHTMLSRSILVLCTASAAAASVGAWPAVAEASRSTQVVEAWRMVGFATFAALFALLAVTPTGHRGLWVVVIVNKLVLSVSAATWLRTGVGSADALVWDGALTALLLTAAVLAQPWRKHSAAQEQTSDRLSRDVIVGSR